MACPFSTAGGVWFPVPENIVMESENILIVEEHPALRAALRDWLAVSFPNYRVNTCLNTNQAINSIKDDAPKLVVLDFNLTRLNAQQAIRSIKTAAPSIKIIVLTLVEDESYRALFLSAGANAQVSKQSLGTNLIPTMEALL